MSEKGYGDCCICRETLTTTCPDDVGLCKNCNQFFHFGKCGEWTDGVDFCNQCKKQGDRRMNTPRTDKSILQEYEDGEIPSPLHIGCNVVVKYLAAELATAKQENEALRKCNTCGGDGLTASGTPNCICGGTGMAADELHNLRVMALDLDAAKREIERLRLEPNAITIGRYRIVHTDVNKVLIQHDSGEGGIFNTDTLEEVISKFYSENF